MAPQSWLHLRDRQPVISRHGSRGWVILLLAEVGGVQQVSNGDGGCLNGHSGSTRNSWTAASGSVSIKHQGNSWRAAA